MMRGWRGRGLARLGAAGIAALAAASATTTVAAQVSSPAAITVSPECGAAVIPGAPPSRYGLTVTGRDFNPFAGVLVSFDFAAGGRPETFRARTDGFGRFRMDIEPLLRHAGAYVVRADDLRQREATAHFTVPCPSVEGRLIEFPGLRLNPAIGPPGFVTSAIGSGFPPGATVRLLWSHGLTVPGLRIVADADGSFTVPVLVYHRDQLGPRELRATSAGGPSFPPVAASYLVVPGNLQPGEFRDRR